MPPASRMPADKFFRHWTFIEAAWPLRGNRLERRRKIVLNELVALLQTTCRPAGRKLFGSMASGSADRTTPATYQLMSSATMKPSRANAMAGASRSGSLNLPEPYFSSASAETCDSAGNADAKRLIAGFFRIRLTVAAEKHVAGRGGRCTLAVVDGDVLAAVRQVNNHEATAADISGTRISHGHRETGGDRGVDCIAAAGQNITADLRRDPLLGDDHAALCGNRLERSDCGVGVIPVTRVLSRMQENTDQGARGRICRGG